MDAFCLCRIYRDTQVPSKMSEFIAFKNEILFFVFKLSFKKSSHYFLSINKKITNLVSYIKYPKYVLRIRGTF